MLNNKKGSILPFVLVTFFVAVTFSIALASNSLVQNSLSNQEIKQEQAFLSAKSMSDYIEDNINYLAQDLLNSGYVSLVSDNGLGSIKAKFEKSVDSTYLLTVQASSGGSIREITTIFKKESILTNGVTYSNSIKYCSVEGLHFPKNKHEAKTMSPFFQCNNDSTFNNQFTM